MFLNQLNTIRDSMVRDLLRPQKILIAGNGVQNPEHLLSASEIQNGFFSTDVTVLTNQDGKNPTLLLDFGKEIHGGIKFITAACSSADGKRIRVTFGESVGEAMRDNFNGNGFSDHSVHQAAVKLPQSGDFEFGNTGFRFVRIELTDADSLIEIISIYGVFVHRDIEFKGKFECSDSLINDIYDTAAHTCFLNMQTYLWDGIKRDRVVWAGDMHPHIMALRTVFGNDPIVRESLKHVAGKYPPSAFPNGMVTYGMWWVMSLYDWYQYSGDKKLLDELADYLKSLLLSFANLINPDGSDSLGSVRRGYFFDWPTFEKPEAAAGVRALLSRALTAGAELCKILNENNLEEVCREKAKALNLYTASHINKNTYTDKNSWEKSKQAAAMMFLAGQLDKKRVANVLAYKNGYGLSVYMGYYILTAAAQSSGINIAAAMMKEYFGGMISAGATSFWEDFDVDWLKPGATIERVLQPGEYDIHGDNGAHCYESHRHSLCHAWGSGVAAFIAENILGVQILKPGCNEIRIAPQLGDLEWARGVYPTPHGNVNIEHIKENGKISTKITAPDEIEIKCENIKRRYR